MSMFKSTKQIEGEIDNFLDTVNEGALVFTEAVHCYLASDEALFMDKLKRIDDLEGRADQLRRHVETQLYRYSLIPEHRGDVLGLLENMDNVIDMMKENLFDFSVEKPKIPDEFDDSFVRLAEASRNAAEWVVVSARAFFRDPETVNDHLFKVYHYEREADQISLRLKEKIFSSSLDLASKIHLRYFVNNVERVSDMAEAVGERLAIYSIKRTV